MQLWSGMVARTSPGWNLLIRPLPNFPRAGGYDLFEGIIQSDRWFGPLFTESSFYANARSDKVAPRSSIAQLQLLPGRAFSEETLDAMNVISSISDLGERDWNDWISTVVEPNSRPTAHPELTLSKRAETAKRSLPGDGASGKRCQC